MARVMNLSQGTFTSVKPDDKEVNLDKVIDDYFQANKLKQEQEKIVKANGEIIKNQLNAKKLTEYNSGKHIAKINKSESIEYDDEKLLKLAKELPSELSSQIIQTIEVVNMEKLERLVIEGKLDTKQFKDAEVKKTITKLYVK